MLLALFLLLCLPLSAFEKVQIPTLGGSVIEGGGCNDDGIVIGSSFTESEELHVFRYNLKTQKLEDLGVLALGQFTFGSAINKKGDLAGSSGNNLGARAWFQGADDSAMKELGLSKPIKTSFGILQPQDSFAMAMNDFAAICGQQQTVLDGKQYMRAMYYDSQTGMIDLRTPSTGSGEAIALAMNNKFVVVGMARLANGTGRACMWELGPDTKDKMKVKKVHFLDGFEESGFSQGSAINNKGLVVGYFQDRSNNAHAFMWSKKDGLTDLGFLQGETNAKAQGINDKGLIAGVSGDKAFIWKEGKGMVDLHVSGKNLQVVSINNKGVVLVNVDDDAQLYAIYTKNLED